VAIYSIVPLMMGEIVPETCTVKPLQIKNAIVASFWTYFTTIRRHFGKQMNKETKLRIHNITAKAALKFGSEGWVLRKREEQRLEAAQIKNF